MPGWDGAGNFALDYDWTDDAAAGTKILASRHDTQDETIRAGIEACVAKNGENTATANLPMGGFKHTGAGVASANGHYVRYDEFSVEHADAGTHKSVSLSVSAAATPVAKTAYEDSIVKAWLKQGGTTTPTITDDVRISSITDTAVGDRRPAFATNMASADYALLINTESGGTAATGRVGMPLLSAQATTGYGYQQMSLDSLSDPTEVDNSALSLAVGND
ncbi:MAG: hypothetical protein A3E78_09285 [Alphaproteobacteria bacterium RIFCSPHIGHO2_12_FULL_63_12]|nr:MAG: hypothetical protein A3E78_09285 [Alphaproteobacteria bacterium RIFCSPHIGHO2_12_FULL_63_12]